MSERLQKVFEYVRETYFPEWDQGREWKITDSTEELSTIRRGGLDGQCVANIKTIKINMARRYSKDALHCLLIHEICHHDTTGHAEDWQNAMLEVARMAEQNGNLKLSRLIRKDIEGGIIVEEYHEFRLGIEMYCLVQKCVDDYPNISSNELIPRLIEKYGVPRDIPEKWIEKCKSSFNHIKSKVISSTKKNNERKQSIQAGGK